MDEFKLWYRGFADEWGVWIGLATLVCLILLSIAKRIGILPMLEIWFQYAIEWATWMLIWAGILFYILYKFDDWREVKAETWILLVSIIVFVRNSAQTNYSEEYASGSRQT